MQKTSRTLYQAAEAIQNVLNAAGFVNGQSLTQDQIKTETRLIFWEEVVPNNGGSTKESYVFWGVRSIVPLDFADGDTRSQTVRVEVTIYTNKPRTHQSVRSAIEALDDAAIGNRWFLTLDDAGYNSTLKQFAFQFTATSVFFEEE